MQLPGMFQVVLLILVYMTKSSYLPSHYIMMCVCIAIEDLSSYITM